MSVDKAWEKYAKDNRLDRIAPEQCERIKQAFYAAHEQGFIYGTKVQRHMTRQQLGLSEGEAFPI